MKRHLTSYYTIVYKIMKHLRWDWFSGNSNINTFLVSAITYSITLHWSTLNRNPLRLAMKLHLSRQFKASTFMKLISLLMFCFQYPKSRPYESTINFTSYPSMTVREIKIIRAFSTENTRKRVNKVTVEWFWLFPKERHHKYSQFQWPFLGISFPLGVDNAVIPLL